MPWQSGTIESTSVLSDLRTLDPSTWWLYVKPLEYQKFYKSKDYFFKKYIGGPGCMWLKSNKGAVKRYDLGRWCMPEHESIQIFVDDINDALKDYIINVAGWSEEQYTNHQPTLTQPKLNRLSFIWWGNNVQQGLLNELNLEMIFDPNASCTAYLFGLSHNYVGAGDLFKIKVGWENEDKTLYISDSVPWKTVVKNATHKIRSKPWGIGYLHDTFFVKSSMIRMSEMKYTPIDPTMSVKDSLCKLLKETILNAKWATSPICNLLSAEKLHITYTDVLKLEVVNMSTKIHGLQLEFSPTMAELFNWDPQTATKMLRFGETKIFTAPAYNKGSILSPTNPYNAVTLPDNSVALHVGGPDLLDASKRLLHFTYYDPGRLGIQQPVKTAVCGDAMFCQKSEAQFELLTKEGANIHTYALHEAQLHTKGRLTDAMGVSLDIHAGASTPRPLAHHQIIEDVVLKVGDFTLYESNGLRPIQQRILELLYPPEHRAVEPLPSDSLIGSKEFEWNIPLFNYNNTPPCHLLATKDPISLNVKFAQPNIYLMSSDASPPQRNIQITNCEVHMPSGLITKSMQNSMDYALRHNTPTYTYEKREIESHVLPEGKFSYKINIMNGKPLASRYVIALQRTTKAVNQDLTFISNGVAFIEMKYGKKTISQSYLLPMTGENRAHVIKERMNSLRNKNKENLASMEPIDLNSLFIFDVNLVDDASLAPATTVNEETEDAEADSVTVTVSFHKKKTSSTRLIVMSEMTETFYTGVDGRIRILTNEEKRTKEGPTIFYMKHRTDLLHIEDDGLKATENPDIDPIDAHNKVIPEVPSETEDEENEPTSDSTPISETKPKITKPKLPPNRSFVLGEAPLELPPDYNLNKNPTNQ